MRIGLDSYAFHRLLGEVRPGEEQPNHPPLPRGYLDVVATARRLGLDVVSLETNVLPPPAALDVAAVRAEAGPGMQLVLAHGHPEGIEFGANVMQRTGLLGWLALAGREGLPLVRCVAGGPRSRARTDTRERVEGTVRALREPCAIADRHGIALALENHADLTLVEVEAILEGVGAPNLGVCFDTSNWVRVGDDPMEAARRLAGRVLMVHLKDHVVRPDDGITGPASAPYGEGEVDLLGVLDTILGADPRIPVCVEIAHVAPGGDEMALIEQAVDWLRAHASRWPAAG